MKCSNDSIELLEDVGVESLYALIPPQPASSVVADDGRTPPLQPEGTSQIPSSFGQALILQALEHNRVILSRCDLSLDLETADTEQLYKRIPFVLDSIATKGAGEGKAFMTAGGLIGWAPWTMSLGCVLLHLPGSDFLLVLRRHKDVFNFLGMACVPGVGADFIVDGLMNEEEFVIP
ncbi:hypothetical protein LTR78_010005 [Recurvomyces mirabilis]|uniref:Uncharacterized protein n=1 Tax=Recurvomyces mirabilis TaxID=574656 RepID=A0AAE0TM84_9PEZI|nr:hypothetical protein LTR78_010005 [Recurvomyces mirabilis]KAK5149786.1 hypothetical protein LTS14_010607 [Recurvomyces mirabilis]